MKKISPLVWALIMAALIGFILIILGLVSLGICWNNSLPDLWLNVGTEVLGIAITVALIDMFVKNRIKEEGLKKNRKLLSFLNKRIKKVNQRITQSWLIMGIHPDDDIPDRTSFEKKIMDTDLNVLEKRALIGPDGKSSVKEIAKPLLFLQETQILIEQIKQITHFSLPPQTPLDIFSGALGFCSKDKYTWELLLSLPGPYNENWKGVKSFMGMLYEHFLAHQALKSGQEELESMLG